MQPATNQPDKAPDTAESYERADPKKQSPTGQVDAPKPPPADEEDHLQDQNAKPTAHKGTTHKGTKDTPKQ